MKKNIIFFVLVFLFVSCSNVKVKNKEEDINIFLERVKNNIKNSNFSNIEKDFERNIYNEKTIEELKKYNLENVKILFGKVKIDGRKAKNIIGLVFSEEVIYLRGKYKLVKGKWKIERVENGR